MLQVAAALVTGSTSGIGLDIARSLAQQGTDVPLNGFGEAAVTHRDCDEAACEFGCGVEFGPTNLSKSADVCGIGQSARDLGLDCFMRERRGDR